MFQEKSFSNNLLWNSFGSFVYLVSQFLLVAICVKLSSDFKSAGVLSLAISVTNIFASISLANVRQYLVSDTKRLHNDGSYVSFRIISSFVAFVSCFLYVLLFTYPLHQIWTIMLYMLFKIGEAIVDMMHAFEQREHRMDIGGKSLLIRGILSLVSFVITLLLTDNINYSILSMIFSTFVVIYIYDLRQVRKFTPFIPKMNLNQFRILCRDFIPLTIATVLANITFVYPRQILEKIEGLNVLGIYTAIAMPSVFVQVAASYVFNPLIATFSEHVNQNRRKEFLSLFAKTLLVLCVISIMSIVGILLFGDIILRILFNEDILKYSYLFLPVIILSCLNAFVWFLWNVLIIFRTLKEIMALFIVGFIFVGIYSNWFIEAFGMNGVSLILLIYCMFTIIVMFSILYIEIKRKFY